tara:strand:- start:374 stop:1282 length:909 start_codon:yes stop_codon:yes gene_type:complete
MLPLLLHPTNWKDYSLVDSGNGKKLERFSNFLFSRPEPQALWLPRLSLKEWEKSSGTFLSSSNPLNKDANGKWSLKNYLPLKWEMEYDNIKFFATPTPFRHLGFFPDQSPHWLWAANKIQAAVNYSDKPFSPKVLNLFGYSGLASLHAAFYGASVTHVDASKKAINLAFENRNLSSFQDLPIKFITDDAVKFVKREIRRENKYDAIILDPPKYGRGPNGEIWDFFNDLPILLELITQVLTPEPIFIILNSYAIRSSHLALHFALDETMRDFSGKVESGELSIVEDQENPRQINTAIFARWEQ